MSEIEKIQRYINRTDKQKHKRYCMRFDEMKVFFEMVQATPCEALCLAFDYGCAKGYQAAKAEGKA